MAQSTKHWPFCYESARFGNASYSTFPKLANRSAVPFFAGAAGRPREISGIAGGFACAPQKGHNYRHTFEGPTTLAGVGWRDR